MRPSNLKGSRYIDFLVPGLLAFSLLTTSLYGTGMCIVSNRRENLLKRYQATPMRSHEYILSHIIGRYLIMSIEIITVLATAVLCFDFSIAGNLFDFFILALLGASCFTALAVLCSSRIANSATYNGLVNLLILPMVFLGGIWFPSSHFPNWIQSISELLPLTALSEGLRSIALEGTSLIYVWPQIIILLSYLALFFLLSKLRFRWF